MISMQTTLHNAMAPLLRRGPPGSRPGRPPPWPFPRGRFHTVVRRTPDNEMGARPGARPGSAGIAVWWRRVMQRWRRCGAAVLRRGLAGTSTDSRKMGNPGGAVSTLRQVACLRIGSYFTQERGGGPWAQRPTAEARTPMIQTSKRCELIIPRVPEWPCRSGGDFHTA